MRIPICSTGNVCRQCGAVSTYASVYYRNATLTELLALRIGPPPMEPYCVPTLCAVCEDHRLGTNRHEADVLMPPPWR